MYVIFILYMLHLKITNYFEYLYKMVTTYNHFWIWNYLNTKKTFWIGVLIFNRKTKINVLCFMDQVFKATVQKEYIKIKLIHYQTYLFFIRFIHHSTFLSSNLLIIKLIHYWTYLLLNLFVIKPICYQIYLFYFVFFWRMIWKMSTFFSNHGSSRLTILFCI